MRLFGAIEKFDRQADGTLVVSGVASSESLDSDGEITSSDAIRKALPDWMKWGNIREMHKASAVGRAIGAEVDTEGNTRVTALIVDSEAIKKVENKVYRGFSIGGTALSKHKNVITRLQLSEISLVDRPANPDCIFKLWKAEKAEPDQHMMDEGELTADDLHQGARVHADFRCGMNPPSMVADEETWHKAKEEALKSYNLSDDAFWPACVHIYKQMGGEIKAEAGEKEKIFKKDKAPDEGEHEYDHEDHYSKYGDVEYADQRNHKYPVDTDKHVRAALSYFAMERNKSKYSPAEQHHILGRIYAAAHKHGIKVNVEKVMITLDQKVLAKAFGLPETSTEQAITEELTKRLSVTASTGADTSAVIEKLNKTVEGLTKRQEDNDKQIAKAEKAALVAEATAAGKVIPLSNEEIDETPTKTLKAMISKLGTTVPMAPRARKPLDEKGKEEVVKGSFDRGANSMTKFFKDNGVISNAN